MPPRASVGSSSMLGRVLYWFGGGDNVLATFHLAGLLLLGVSILARIIMFAVLARGPLHTGDALRQLPLVLVLAPALVAALGFLCMLIGGLRLVSRMRCGGSASSRRLPSGPSTR